MNPTHVPSMEDMEKMRRCMVVKNDRVIRYVSYGNEKERFPGADFMITEDFFPAEKIKNGRVLWKDFLRLPKGGVKEFACGVLEVHNENNSPIVFADCLYGIERVPIEPHGSRKVIVATDVLKVSIYPAQPNDTWMDNIWIECPNGKSPKVSFRYSKEEEAVKLKIKKEKRKTKKQKEEKKEDEKIEKDPFEPKNLFESKKEEDKKSNLLP